jgi:hypothetical protein
MSGSSGSEAASSDAVVAAVGLDGSEGSQPDEVHGVRLEQDDEEQGMPGEAGGWRASCKQQQAAQQQ